MLKLGFMGTPAFSVPSLRALHGACYPIAAVYTQPPKPAGRGQSIHVSPVHAAALELGLDVRTPVSMKAAAEIAAFEALRLDAAIVVAYGQILVPEVLAAPRLGCFNVHASLLPRWRGAAPIHRALMAGDRATGVMVMRMEAGLDTGPILSTWQMAIPSRATTGDIHDRLSVEGAQLLVETLHKMLNGPVQEIPQAADGVTYAKKISNAQTQIDWTLDCDTVDCFVRGLSPTPGAWTLLLGERVKILLSEPVAANGTPGEVLDHLLTIACGQGAIRPLRLQRAGKGPQDLDTFLRGYPVVPGTRLGV